MNIKVTIHLITLIITCAITTKVTGQDLKKHKWNNRILIIKTTDQNSIKYTKQIKEFTNLNAELKDRKFILYWITNNNFSAVNYLDEKLNYSDKITERFARKTLNKKEPFEIILIGLDGRKKLKQTQVLTKEQLFSVIDAMPMRINEMNNKK